MSVIVEPFTETTFPGNTVRAAYDLSEIDVATTFVPVIVPFTVISSFGTILASVNAFPISFPVNVAFVASTVYVTPFLFTSEIIEPFTETTFPFIARLFCARFFDNDFPLVSIRE